MFNRISCHCRHDTVLTRILNYTFQKEKNPLNLALVPLLPVPHHFLHGFLFLGEYALCKEIAAEKLPHFIIYIMIYDVQVMEQSTLKRWRKSNTALRKGRSDM